MHAPKVDKHNEKWCGYFKNKEAAQVHFDEQLKHMSRDNLIVSAKMEYGNASVHGLLLYKFAVITADKNNK
jgi:hypothetical protein